MRETEGPERAYAELIGRLPPAKRAELASKYVKPPKTFYTQRVRVVPPSAGPQVVAAKKTQTLRPRYVPDSQKQADRNVRRRLLCEAFGGQVPGSPAGMCTASP
jgi:hypothetical protein